MNEELRDLSELDRSWLGKISELGVWPANHMPGKLQARYLRRGWISVTQGALVSRVQLTAAGVSVLEAGRA